MTKNHSKLLHYTFFDSTLGKLWITLHKKKLCGIYFHSSDLYYFQHKHKYTLKAIVKLPSVLERELTDYFKGKLKKFQYPICFLTGTAFQQKVWQVLTKIPYGRTKTYGEVAKAVKSPKAARAVGSANGSNQIPIVVPCHRVVASKSLGGYSEGLDIKKQLLQLESGIRFKV
ncbi:MAG: methylated-DNA--[protein]-cysteine S-methyltransferase [Deltaproteobacteria bacterium]|nr:methylated-DNA--[protein]-cysteine S-methyltransferase [Deltaproteobacteria bacterium]